MNIKAVLFVTLCVVVLASAKPNKKVKKEKEKKEDKEDDYEMNLLDQYVRLCEGLNDGEIENTEAKYDDVFTQFNVTCAEVLEYDTDEEEEASEERKKNNKGGNKGGKKGGKGGKKNKKNKAEEILMYICASIGVQNYLDSFPEDTPSELIDIYVNETYPICQEAYEIKTGGAEEGFIKLCEQLDSEEVENIDSDYQAWFDELEPICTDILAEVEEEAVESDPELQDRRVSARKGKKEKKEKMVVNNALVMLSQSCIKLETVGFPNDTSEEWKTIFGSLGELCNDVLDGPENDLITLCEGLDDGSIAKSDNKRYKKAFRALEPVCEDLLEEEEGEAVESRAKKDKNKGGEKGGKGNGGENANKKKGGKNGKKEDKEDKGEEDLAVGTLVSYCRWVLMQDKVGIPVDYPVYLMVRYKQMLNVCKGVK